MPLKAAIVLALCLGLQAQREYISAYLHMYAHTGAYNHIKTNEPTAQDGNPPDTTKY